MTAFSSLIQRISVGLCIGFGVTSLAWGQVSVTTSGSPVTENFNSMGTSATATLPSGFRVNTSANWNTGTTATSQAAGTTGTGVLTGTSGGGTYNFANGVTGSSTDRALGFLTSGGFTSPRSIIYAFTNNTGSTISEISLSWDYEKYRSGIRAFDWTFFHGPTATSVNTAATAGDQSYAADANNTTINNPPTAIAKSVTITGLSITNGTTYYLCWTYTGVGGSTNAQGLGIDNFSITLNVGSTPNIAISTPHPASTNIAQGTANNILASYQLDVTTASATLTGISVTTAGTYSVSDIATNGFKFWINSTNNLSGATQLGTSQAAVATGGTVAVSSLTQSVPIGTRYILVTADIALGATASSTIRLTSTPFASITFSSANKTGTNPAAASNDMTIIACTPSNATGFTLTSGNTQLTLSWTNPSCLDEVMIVAKPSSTITATPSGDGSAYTANLAFGTGGATAFDGTGFVVYKGSTSPQTITGLTNGTTYFVRIFTRRGTTWSSGVELSATPNVNTYTWSTSTTSNAWANSNNWTSGPANTFPGVDAYTTSTADGASSDIANFTTLAFTGNNLGLNFNNTTSNNGVGNNSSFNGSLILGALHFSALSKDIIVGKSDGSSLGSLLTLNGVNINSVPNTVIRQNSTFVATIAGLVGGTAENMRLTLGNSSNNIITVDNSANLIISCVISSASGPVTIDGSGSGIVEFSGQNTYTTNTIVKNTTLRLNRTGGNTLPATNNVTVEGGILRISTNQTLNNLTLTGGNVIVDAGITLTINGTLTRSGGSIDASATGATIVFSGASAQSIPASTFTGNIHNLTLNNSAGLTLNQHITVANTLTLTTGTLTIGANTLTLNGSISRTSGNIDGSNASATVVFSGTSAQSIPSSAFTGNIHNLTLNNSAGLSISQPLTIANTLTLTSGTLTVGANTVTLNGSISRTSGNMDASNASATIVFSGTSAQSIPASTFTGNIHNLTLNNSAGLTLNQSVTIDGTLTLTHGALAIGSHVCTINGNISRTSGSIRGGLATDITLAGSGGSVSLHMDASALGTSNRIRNLTVNRSSSTITLANSVLVSGVLTVTSGTLASGGQLTLLNSATDSAYVAPLGVGASITGNVVAERYIPPIARRWRFITPTVSGSNLDDWQNELFITGTGGTANGFDAATNNPHSVFWYNEPTSGNKNNGWTAPTSISQTLTTGMGYRLFVRGDRSDANRLTGVNLTQNAVVINTVGPLHTGNISLPISFTTQAGVDDDGWNLLGNPYHSAYNWNEYYDNCTTGCYSNIDPTIWVFDAQTNNYLSYNATSGGTLLNGVIPIGAAFWIKANASSPSLQFQESYKSTINNDRLFKTATNELALELRLDSIHADRFILKHIVAAQSGVDGFDIPKMFGSVNLYSMVQSNQPLNLDCRNTLTSNDTVELYVNGTSGTYIIRVNQVPLNAKYYYLKDRFTNAFIPLHTHATYSFAISTTQAATFGNRFYIVISNSQSLPVSYLSISAVWKERDIQLEWQTSEESNNDYFEIEHSTDGTHFTSIGTHEAKGNSQQTTAYRFTHSEPSADFTHYYRLKQVDQDGTHTYSDIVTVSNREIPALQKRISPIPASDFVTVQGAPTGCTYTIINMWGIHIDSGILPEDSRLTVEQLPTGYYILQLHSAGETQTFKLAIER